MFLIKYKKPHRRNMTAHLKIHKRKNTINGKEIKFLIFRYPSINKNSDVEYISSVDQFSFTRLRAVRKTFIENCNKRYSDIIKQIDENYQYNMKFLNDLLVNLKEQ